MSVKTEPVKGELSLKIDGKPASGWQLAVISTGQDGVDRRYGPWEADATGIFSFEFPFDLQIRGHLFPKLVFPHIVVAVAPPHGTQWFRINGNTMPFIGAGELRRINADVPNQALEPTATAVTHPADAGCAPAVAVAHL